MRKELRMLLALCEQGVAPDSFKNGVTHSGIDQGDVIASQIIADAEEALKRTDIRRAAQALLDQMDIVFGSDEYKGIFTLALLHGVSYTGPCLEDEIKDLREALNED